MLRFEIVEERVEPRVTGERDLKVFTLERVGFLSWWVTPFDTATGYSLTHPSTMDAQRWKLPQDLSSHDRIKQYKRKTFF
jgi:hypothetical protein